MSLMLLRFLDFFLKCFELYFLAKFILSSEVSIFNMTPFVTLNLIRGITAISVCLPVRIQVEDLTNTKFRLI